MTSDQPEKTGHRNGERPVFSRQGTTMSFRRRPLGLALLIAGALITTLLSVAMAQAPPTPPPYDPASVPVPAQPPLAAGGAVIFQQNCAPCHGPQGASDGPTTPELPAPPPHFADPATIGPRSPAEYFHTTKYGRIQNLMPPWGNLLDDEQIWQTVYYAWSLHTDAETVARGLARYEQNCAACHGPSGAGDGPDAPAPLPRFDDAGAMSLRTQDELDAGWQAAHAEPGQDWSPDDRQAVLDAIRTFSYVPPWEATYRPGAGVLSGAVVQGTAGGGPVAGLPVTLTAFVNFQPAEAFTTTTDANGGFGFADLATDAGVAYVATTSYASVRHNSAIYQFDPLTPTGVITLPVYETTDSNSALHIGRANWLVDLEPGGLRVAVVLALSNQSDRTFVGQPVEGVDGLATLEVLVPEGATEIEFEDGVLNGRYQQVGNRIYDVVPIAPGAETRQLFYSYRLPYQGTEVSFVQGFAYPLADLNLLITELAGMDVEAPALTYVGTETVQGFTFRRWAAQALAGQEVAVRIRGLIPAGDPDPRAVGGNEPGALVARPATAQIEPLAALSLAGIVLVALAVTLYIPLRRQARLDQRAALSQERASLIQQIAELDDQHAAGQLAADGWAQERARLKRALLAVAQELDPP